MVFTSQSLKRNEIRIQHRHFFQTAVQQDYAFLECVENYRTIIWVINVFIAALR
ncbi:hypothetical protein QOZ95_001662 [Paenibacillus brasilensis]|uniref:Uncharacterized protein n=1 Tax=Paenibacillus brasilensis TaxID=128574 RepID=A0ABU0KVP4_9BACL|nr:hypothetical protein [Paenibacillus brasilensis]